MAEMTYRQAVAAGIAQEMERDPSVVLLGEDVGAAGGVFKLTEGLFEQFGPERVRDTPISEQAIVGAAMGAAMTGLRPIAELMFSDFFAVTWDMVVNQIAKTRYMTDGQVSLPLVIHTANGAGLRFGAQHSQAIENWAMAIPGLKVVAPSTPADMLGLMAAAIRDPDPVIVCDSKALLAVKGEVPDGEHVVPLGKAAIVREGSDCTIVALASMVPRSLEAAERLAGRARDLGGGHRPPVAGPARRRDDPRLGREDEPAVHGGGEPAPVRLGRRDRVARRGRGVLQPRRAPGPDHDAAHPAALGAGARGRGAAVGGADHRDRPAAGSRRRGDGTPAVVGLVGIGRMGGSMARALAREGRRLVIHNRTPDKAQALADALGEGVATVAATPAEVAATRGRHADDAGRRRRGRRGVRGRQRAARRRPRRDGPRRPEHGDAVHDPRASSRGSRAAGAGILDAPVSGSTATAESGQLTLMVGGTAEDLERARPPSSRSPSPSSTSGRWAPAPR